MRDNFRNTKVKVVTLPALGEVLYLIANQVSVKPKHQFGLQIETGRYGWMCGMTASYFGKL